MILILQMKQLKFGEGRQGSQAQKVKMHSLKLFILLSINDFLSTNHGLGIVLETRDRGVNKTQARIGFCRLGMYVEKGGQT